jgi:very-short-patch-repair endonuclease
VFTRAEAGVAGYSDEAIRYALKSGRWIKLLEGIYVPAETFIGADAARQHALTVAAWQIRLRRPAVASHTSTLRMRNVDLLDDGGKATLSTSTGRSKLYDGARIYVAYLHSDHLRHTPIHGVATTTEARAVVDVARTLSFRAGVVAADSAMHLGLVSRASLRRVVSDCGGWPGIRQASNIVEFAEKKTESPAESLSRVMFREQQIEMPECQVWIAINSEFPEHRVDFLWRRLGVIGEVDGKIKYKDQNARWQEKRREEALQDDGYEVVRWSYGDAINDGPATAARIWRAFARAERRRG